MDDKRFNELMERYFNSTKRGKDLDFLKLRNRIETPKSHKRKLKYLWIIFIPFSVIAILSWCIYTLLS